MTNIYNKTPSNKNLDAEAEQMYDTMNNVKKEKSQSPIVKSVGRVTEITLGDSKFSVHDPVRIENIIKLAEKHESSITQIRQSIRSTNLVIKQLQQRVGSLESELKAIKDKLNNGYQNGYGSSL
ncbi:hypothetical protein EJP02_284 [Escherichia phage EJP2]|nr:hypothetical protein EJP02_284 [Escherichia phage EJP2]